MTARARLCLLVVSFLCAAGLPGGAAAAVSPETLLVAPDGTSPFDPGEGWALRETVRDRGRIRFAFEHRDGPTLDVVLMRRGEAREALHQTRSFDVFHRGRLTDPAEQRLLERVLDALDRGDTGKLALPRRRPALGEARPRMSLPAQISWMIPLDRVQVSVAAALLLAFLLLLPWIGREVYRALAALPVLEARLTAAALAAGAAVRILAPTQLVMIFMGYRYAQEVAAFTAVPKYGAGTFVLYRAVFELFGPSHHAIVAMNTALGVATLPFILALFARLQPGRYAAPLAALLVAFVPLLVKDHVTESILVPIMLWVWCGLLAFDVYLERRARLALCVAAICLTLAMISRPEMLVVVPMLVAVLAWWRAGVEIRAALLRGPVVIVAAACLVLLIPHLIHTLDAVRAESGGDGLPNLRLLFLLELPFRLVDGNAVFRPNLYPIALTALAGLSIAGATGRTRRLLLALVGVSCVWLGIYFLDLPPASIPRLHAPVALLTTLMASVAGAGLLRRLASPRRPAAVLSAGLLAIVTATALPTLSTLWHRTNDDTEDAFFLETVAQLPDEAVCFVRISDPDDPPKRKTHRYYPDYLLQPPHRDDLLLGIRQYEREGHLRCPGPTYYFQGVRCYAMYERPDTAPDAPPMVSSCSRMREAYVLVPVLERTVPNRHAASFNYYPDVPSLDLGLYRVEARQPEGTAAPQGP